MTQVILGKSRVREICLEHRELPTIFKSGRLKRSGVMTKWMKVIVDVLLFAAVLCAVYRPMLATSESLCSQQNVQNTAADAIVKALSNSGWTIQVAVPFSSVITESSDKKTECTGSAEMQNKGRYQDNGHGVMFVPGIHRIKYTIQITDDGKYWIEAGFADETAFYRL